MSYGNLWTLNSIPSRDGSCRLTLSARLKEERQRLGLTQSAFAKVAGVTKSAQIKWESGTSSAPTAPALAAIAEAGADVLYILTGRRSPELPDNPAAQIEADLVEIRRKLLEPARDRQPGEDQQAADMRELEDVAHQLTHIRVFDDEFLSPEVRDEVEHLLDVATQPAALALYRAADFAQQRSRRREMRERLASWLDGGPYLPADTVMNLLASIALEHGVPIKLLIELVQELHDDLAARAEQAERAQARNQPNR